MNSLKLRVVSSFFLFLIFFFLLFSGDFFFLLFLQIFLFLTNWECLRLLEFRKFRDEMDVKSNFFLTRIKVLHYDLFLIISINLLNLAYFFSINLFVFLFLILLILILLVFKKKEITKNLVLFYFSLPYFFLINLRLEENYIYYIVFIVLFAVIVDVSAFFIGKAIGGKKLAKNLSPNKTISGMIGGIMIPAFICFVFFFQQSSFSEIIFTSFFFSAVAQFGDLLESKFKRFCNVKDSSNLIPGHGGILDRLDSIFLLIIFISILKLFSYNFFFIV
ncbi:MAG: phosphatidate cytidylyltransferase [Pseudomonadota bacterium]|nr:phosphatidate cytidylyltransferase [Pseudomonadota bacterium]